MLFPYRNPRYFSRRTQRRFWSFRTIFKWNRERRIYGVSEFDCFSFDSYLTYVLANGLHELKKSKHGVPMAFVEGADLTEKDVAAWNKVLGQACEDAAWLVSYQDRSSEIYDEHMGDVEHSFEKIPGRTSSRMISTATDEQAQAWLEAERELEHEQDRRKNRLLEFVKEHYFSLWD
jgi:hypothetical protein